MMTTTLTEAVRAWSPCRACAMVPVAALCAGCRTRRATAVGAAATRRKARGASRIGREYLNRSSRRVE